MRAALSLSPKSIFNYNRIFLPACLCLIPLAFDISRNYVFTGRGWHIFEIQYVTISWIARLLLIPFILFVIRQFWNVTQTRHSFLGVHAAGAMLFTAAQIGLTMALCLQTSSPDKRIWNLFNTVKDLSFLPDIAIYAISVLSCYLWIDSAPAAAEAPVSGKKVDTLNVKSGQRTSIVRIEDILSIHADGHYTKIVTAAKTSIASLTMREIENMVPSNLVRIHRTTIVNTSYILQTRSLLNGDYMVTMKNGEQHKVSRTYRDNLRSVLGKF